MSLTTALSTKLKNILDGAGGRPSPIATNAAAVLLGTRLNQLASLALTTSGNGASQIGVFDTAGNFTGEDVEAVLAELYTAATTAGSDTFTDTGNFYAVDEVGAAFVELGVAAIGGTSALVRNYTENAVVVDDETLVQSVDSIDARLSITARVMGSIPTFAHLFVNDAAINDTTTVGADVYEFVTSGGTISNDLYIAVERGVSAAATRANWIAAINGVAANPHANILAVGGGAPAIVTNGTLPYFAAEVGTTVRFQLADGVGGTPIAGPYPNALLAENITDAADVWDCGDVNINTLGISQDSGMVQEATVEIIVNAGMIASGFAAAFPFTPVGFSASLRSTAGVQLAGSGNGDTLVIVGDTIVFASGGAGAPHSVATDIYTIKAWSAPA